MDDMPETEETNQPNEPIGNTIQQVFAWIVPAMMVLNDAVWAAYREAEMPYGDSHDGLMRWLEDRGKINQLQAEIDHILQRQQTLVDARKLGDKIRAKRVQKE